MKSLRILCIDPGTLVSGAVEYYPQTMTVGQIFPEEPNELLLTYIEETCRSFDRMLFEMVACYGMPVGRETFETVLWTGNFQHAFGRDRCNAIYRKDVKLNLCGKTQAKDTHVRQALFDRFPAAGGGKTPTVGTKKAPGPLYGVKKHAVSALAVGVAWWEMKQEKERHVQQTRELRRFAKYLIQEKTT